MKSTPSPVVPVKVSPAPADTKQEIIFRRVLWTSNSLPISLWPCSLRLRRCEAPRAYPPKTFCFNRMVSGTVRFCQRVATTAQGHDPVKQHLRVYAAYDRLAGLDRR